MFIAIMTDSPGMKGRVSETFSLSGYLQVIDADAGRISASYRRDRMSDRDLADKIVKHDCEAVICGPIEEEPFSIIADEGCVTRYHGSGLELDEALRKMEAYELPLITDFIGGTGCGSGDGAACDGRHGVDSE